MGTKKEIKEEIIRILEENFNFILNTQDSILNLENTLSTSELKISMYHIRTFMKNKGYIHNKITNEWVSINNKKKNSSNNEDIKDNETILKSNEQNILEHKENLNNSMTDDLKEFLKENSKKKSNTTSDEKNLTSEEKPSGNFPEMPINNIREKSLIPEKNILQEILKLSDNNSYNSEIIINAIKEVSNQLSEINSLLSTINNKNTSDTTDYIKIARYQLAAINYSESKRYEVSLSIGLVDAIKQKFFLNHPEISSIEKLKDSKILPMILFDYLISK